MWIGLEGMVGFDIGDCMVVRMGVEYDQVGHQTSTRFLYFRAALLKQPLVSRLRVAVLSCGLQKQPAFPEKCGLWCLGGTLPASLRIFKSHRGQAGLAFCGVGMGHGKGAAALFHLDSVSGKRLSTCSPTLLSSAACAVCLGWAQLEHGFGDRWVGWQGLPNLQLPLNGLQFDMSCLLCSVFVH